MAEMGPESRFSGTEVNFFHESKINLQKTSEIVITVIQKTAKKFCFHSPQSDFQGSSSSSFLPNNVSLSTFQPPKKLNRCERTFMKLEYDSPDGSLADDLCLEMTWIICTMHSKSPPQTKATKIVISSGHATQCSDFVKFHSTNIF